MADVDKSGGELPAWSVKELPAPPPYTLKNVVKIIGPGAIALSMSIGGGEWLLGPTTIVKYGFSLMWIVTLGVIFQLLLNLEFIRYTVYTGEPAVNGFMRTKPGPVFWAVVYLFLALCQVGWPAWAANSASTVFTMFAGQLPNSKVPDHVTTMRWLGIGTFLLTILLVAFGGRIERMLEFVNWFMVLFIVGFLIVLNVMFVPGKVLWEGFIGHFGFTGAGEFRLIPAGADWLLLGAFAGFAGNGGIGNVWTSNWIRDKGLGMGSVVGYIPSAVGGKVVKVSPIGSIFAITAENIAKWITWWRYVKVDQVWVWAAGCFLGMYLNVTLAVAIIPAGTDMGKGLSPGATQAEFIKAEGARKFDSETAGKVLWFLTLLNGFWILFGSQLTITEGFVRLSTDILWTASPRIRNACGEDIRKIYYLLLVVFAVWGCVAINLLQQFTLFKVAANVAGFILVVAGIHILVLNHRFVPRELRGPAWQRIGIVLAILFYIFFSVMNVYGVGLDQKWWTRT